MVGHAFPIWTGLRGGKAVMAFVGGAFALSPAAAGLCLHPIETRLHGRKGGRESTRYRFASQRQRPVLAAWQ